MALRFDPQIFLAGLAGQNQQPGNPFASFSAGLRGSLVQRALNERNAQQDALAQLHQDLAERAFGLQSQNAQIASRRADIEAQRFAMDQAKNDAAQNAFYGVVPSGSIGPLPPGEVMAPANVPSGGFKDYAAELGKQAATPGKPVKDSTFETFVKEQQYKAAHPEAGGPGVNIEDYTVQTRSGKKFVNIPGTLTGKEKSALTTAAAKAGLPTPTAEQVGGLGVIDKARGNLEDMGNQLEGLVVLTPGARPENYAKTKLQQVFQTNDLKAAFNTWRLSSIALIQGMAAGGKGLRITQPEINQALQNMPQLTDTYGVAKQKMANINSILDNAENPILSKNWGAKSGPAPAAGAKPTRRYNPTTKTLEPIP